MKSILIALDNKLKSELENILPKNKVDSVSAAKQYLINSLKCQFLPEILLAKD